MPVTTEDILKLRDRNVFPKLQPVHAISLRRTYGKPIGWPLLLDNSFLEEKVAAYRVKTVALIAPRASSPESPIILTKPLRHLKKINLRPINQVLKVKYVDSFEAAKLSRLKEYIYDVGGISLCITNRSKQKELVKNLICLEKSFGGYSTTFYFNQWSTAASLSNKKDRALVILSFFSLPYCIPIFNSQKVSGFCLSCSYTTEERAFSSGKVFRLDVGFSEHQDNLLIVDGECISDQLPLEKAYFLKSLEDSIFREPEMRSTKESGKHKLNPRNGSLCVAHYYPGAAPTSTGSTTG